MKTHEIENGEAMSAVLREAMEFVFRTVGGQGRLAQALGISPQAVSQWEAIPALRVLEVQELTGIHRCVLRPDIYPDVLTMARRTLPGPDGIASDDLAIRAFLDARHRNVAEPGVRTAEALVRARNDLAFVLGLVDE